VQISNSTTVTNEWKLKSADMGHEEEEDADADADAEKGGGEEAATGRGERRGSGGSAEARKVPLNDKVQWTSRDVGGGEPPSSPRSEHFTGPFNR